MLSLILGLALAIPANKDATIFRCDVTIYQGNPDGSVEKGDIAVLSKPQIITRNGQDAMMSVGTHIPVVTDIKREVGLITNIISQKQVGIILKLTPKLQPDGSVVVLSKVNLNEVIGTDTIKEQTISTCRVHQPGETIKVPFYCPESCKTGFPNFPFFFMKYAGNEVWMEVKVTPMKESELKP